MRRYWIVIMDLNITVANPNSNCELEKKKPNTQRTTKRASVLAHVIMYVLNTCAANKAPYISGATDSNSRFSWHCVYLKRFSTSVYSYRLGLKTQLRGAVK